MGTKPSSDVPAIRKVLAEAFVKLSELAAVAFWRMPREVIEPPPFPSISGFLKALTGP